MKIIKISLLLSLLFLASCSIFEKHEEPPPPVKIITEVIEPELYAPPLPREVQLEDVRWYVLTRDNIEEQMDAIENHQGGPFVVFAMTPQAYENMAYNLQEILRYIQQQQEIIQYYIEATKPKGREGWISENEARREQIEQALEPTEEENTQPIFGVGDLLRLF